MNKLHPLLQKQVKIFFEGKSLPPEMAGLLEKISQTYALQDQEKERVEEKLAEACTQRACSEEELAKANKELDRFVYSVSHDLRAPMTTLLGLLNISEHEQDLEALRQYQVLMRNSLKRMDHFISNLLNYSSSNRLENNPEPVCLKELTQEVASSLRHLPHAFSIDLITDFEAGVPFYSDLHKIKIILSNLLSNAILFHNLEQDRPYIHLKSRIRDSGMQLTIEDNGQGIEEQYHKKIFEMFFRANKSATGNGLGLYIVKETIEKLDGQLSFRSALNEGTTFTIELPNMVPAASRTAKMHVQKQ